MSTYLQIGLSQAEKHACDSLYLMLTLKNVSLGVAKTYFTTFLPPTM